MVPEPPAAGEDRRIPIVDAVRLFSILAVMAVHLSVSGLVLPSNTPWIADASIAFARNGMYGVILFFVVSGFVITRTIVRRQPDLRRLDLRDFYARRAGRILPLLAVTVLLGALLLHVLPTDLAATRFSLHAPQARFDGWLWLSIGTFSFNWLRLAREAQSPGFGLHWDVLWSLSIEEQFYLLYPLLLRALGSRRRIAVALCALVVVGPLGRLAAAALRPGSPHARLTNSFAALDLLALGALLAFLIEAAPAPSRRWRAAESAAGLLGLCGVAAAYGCSDIASPLDCVWAPSALGLSLCVLLFCGVRRGWCGSAAGRLLSAPGQLSYGSYLLHPLIIAALWPVLLGRSAVGAFVALAAVTLGIAAIVYRRFEVPANRLVRRLAGRGPRAERTGEGPQAEDGQATDRGGRAAG